MQLQVCSLGVLVFLMGVEAMNVDEWSLDKSFDLLCLHVLTDSNEIMTVGVYQSGLLSLFFSHGSES